MPTEIIGRYEVGDVIGRGAMAVVYKATDPTIGRSVALKVMRFDTHGIEKSEVLSRFRNEARAAGKLLHPNLVTIYDAGEQEGTFYIAMECVEGYTLQALLAEQRFLTLDRTVDILSQICAGLDYAHANGVIHRDIKPANIMLTRSGVVKIMDFGIAKSGTQLTTAGDVLGTPNYISPEMVKGEAIDGRSDLFSVAVILHEMLLGERPFTAPNISTIIYKIVNEPPSPDLETKVHPAMAAVLRKALAKLPKDRYQSGTDLTNAVKSYQAMLTEPLPTAIRANTALSSDMGRDPGDETGYVEQPVAPVIRPARSAARAVDSPPVFGTNVPTDFRGAAPTVKSQPAYGSLREPSTRRPGDRNVEPPPVIGTKPVSKDRTWQPAPSAVRGMDDPIARARKRKAQEARVLKAILTLAVILAAVAVVAIRWRARTPSPASTPPAKTEAVTTPNAASPQKSPDRSTKGKRAEAPALEQTPETEAEKNTGPEFGRTSKGRSGAHPQSLANSAAANAEQPGARGTLAVTSAPSGASVQIDGHGDGNLTPFTATNLRPGTHTLVFSKQGYETVTRTVQIAAGQDATVAVSLTLVSQNSESSPVVSAKAAFPSLP